MCICVMMIFLRLICIFVIDVAYTSECLFIVELVKLYMYISDIIKKWSPPLTEPNTILFLLDTRVKFEETKCKILKEDLCTED